MTEEELEKRYGGKALKAVVHAMEDERDRRAARASARPDDVPPPTDADGPAPSREKLDAEIDEFARRDAEGAPAMPPKRPRWRRCRELVDEIIARANEPWIPLTLGGEQIATVRAGGIVLLIGGTGRGKTSLAGNLLVEHAKERGPAISMSIELPGDEWTARMIGAGRDLSWMEALQARASREDMIAALPERLAIIDREDSSLRELERAIVELRIAHPDEPVLIAVDYVQILELGSEDEIRARVGQVMRELDKVARRLRVVLIALSQGSRVATRSLNTAEKLGADTTDTGAESADLERWATITLAIGQLGPAAEDGSARVDLSLGKSRMGGGDRVVPARTWGRTGRWRLDGEARPAAEVKAERVATKNEQQIANVAHTIAGILGSSSSPMSVAAMKREIGGDGNIVSAAARRVISDGRAVRVKGRKAGGFWPLWTREQAAKHGVDLVPEGVP